MSIRPIKVNDKTHYTVIVFKRSRKDRSLRVKRQKANVSSLAEAKKIERLLEREAQDRLADLEFRGSCLERLINRWFDHNLKVRVEAGEILEKTLREDLTAVNKWLRQYKSQQVIELTPYAMKQVFREMKCNGASHRQQMRLKRMIRNLIEFGKHFKMIPKEFNDPTVDVSIKTDGEKTPEILSLPEIQKLLAKAVEWKHPWRHVWAIALLTGMRSGELRALSWNDVDFDNKILRVSKSMQAATGNIKSTKAGYWRDVPINNQLLRVLDELRPQTFSSCFVLPSFSEWDKGEQAKILRTFCTSIGITPVKFHTLRACFATQLLRQGVEPAKVMKVAGWKDLSTMQRYIRLAGIEVSGVTEKLDLLPPINYSDRVVSFHGV